MRSRSIHYKCKYISHGSLWLSYASRTEGGSEAGGQRVAMELVIHEDDWREEKRREEFN